MLHSLEEKKRRNQARRDERRARASATSFATVLYRLNDKVANFLANAMTTPPWYVTLTGGATAWQAKPGNYRVTMQAWINCRQVCVSLRLLEHTN